MFDRRLFKIVLEDHPALAAFIITGLCSLLNGGLIVLQAYALSQIIQRAFLLHTPLGGLVPLFWRLLWIVSGRAGLTLVKEHCATSCALRMKDNLRTRLLHHLTRLGPVPLRRERTGELTNTVLEGIEALEPYFRDYLPQAVGALVIPLTILLVVFPIDWISGLVFLFTAPLIPLFMVLIGSLTRTYSQQQWQALGRMSAHYFDVLQGLTTLKIFNQSRPQAAKIAEIGEDHRRVTMRVLRVAFLSAFSLEFLATLSTAVVAVGIGLRLLYGQLDFSNALCVLFLAPDFYLPLRLLGSRFHAALGGMSAAERIFALLDLPIAPETQPLTAEKILLPGSPPPREITFENVDFSYETDLTRALNGVTLRWRCGEKIALVGPSGAGKSTLTNLLMRFIRPSRGVMRVDGLDLAQIDPTFWRSKIAWVPQNPFLFNASIEENIRLTNPSASSEEVQSAARLARAHGFIQSLPQGYQTLIGEHGLALSAGQAQRIALARTLLKDDPWLLILDEAAANLDPYLQTLTGEALDLGWSNRFTLTVAHRLSSAARSDKVLVLDEGKLVQEGTHENLGRQAGLYREMTAADIQDSGPDYNQTTREPASVNLPTPGLPETDMSYVMDDNTPQDVESGRPGILKPFLLSLLFGLAAILSNVGLMGTSAYIISAAALHPSVADLQVAIVAVRFFGIVRAVLRYCERYVSHRVTLHVLTRLRVWFYRALEPLAPARLLFFHQADLLTRIVSDISSLENFYVRVFYPPLVALSTALIICSLLGQFEPGLGLWLALGMASGGLGLPVLMYFLARAPAAEAVQQRADLNMAVSDHIQGLADLLAAGADKRHLANVLHIHRRLQTSQQKMGSLTGLQDGLILFITHLSVLILLWTAIPHVEQGRMDGVYLAVIAMIALAAFEGIQPLAPAAQVLRGNLAAVGRLREIVDTHPALSDPPIPAHFPARYDLEITGLSFTYPGRSEPAIDDIHIKIPAGRHVALVGESGAGKSTLLNLLLRFWDYQVGEIRLGGSSMKSLSQEEIRQHLAVLYHPSEIFNTTVRENLLLANPNATQAEIIAAAAAAEIHTFISALPKGYETVVGEGGARLSAGERQRLALARVLLRPAPILALDEPTANLDAITEKRVLANLFASTHGRTLLLITHRLVALENMDEILVMQAGRIVERGTHATLLDRAGIYAQQIRLQNDWFDMHAPQ